MSGGVEHIHHCSDCRDDILCRLDCDDVSDGDFACGTCATRNFDGIIPQETVISREKARERWKRYAEAHPDRMKAVRLKYHKAHPEVVREAGRRWRQRNIGEQRGRVRQLQQARQAFMNWLKAAPCADCEGDFPPECMDFDHARGAKAFDIVAGRSRTLDVLQGEIMKCDLICSNCHRVRTKLRGWVSRINGGKR